MAQDEVLSQGGERGEVHGWAGKGGDGKLVGPRGEGAGSVGGEIGERKCKRRRFGGMGT